MTSILNSELPRETEIAVSPPNSPDVVDPSGEARDAVPILGTFYIQRTVEPDILSFRTRDARPAALRGGRT